MPRVQCRLEGCRWSAWKSCNRYRHERNAHGWHGGRKFYLCPYSNCTKSLEGKGFTEKRNLNHHIRKDHIAAPLQTNLDLVESSPNSQLATGTFTRYGPDFPFTPPPTPPLIALAGISSPTNQAQSYIGRHSQSSTTITKHPINPQSKQANTGTETEARSQTNPADRSPRRQHRYYQIPPGADRLFHCPYRPECKHGPTPDKRKFEEYIDQHTGAFKCGHPKCTQSFGCASSRMEHEIMIHFMHSGPHIDSHPPPISRRPVEGLAATESLGGRIGVVRQDTAAYATHVVQNHFQDEPNNSGFEGWCTTVPVPEMVEFEDSNQFCPAAPLQDPVRRDPNSQLATNDLVRPYEYTSSNNSIVAVDPHDYTTLSKPVQLTTPDTSYDEKQVLSARDSQTSSTINSLSIPGIFPNLERSILEPKESEKSQDIVLQSATPPLLDMPSCPNTHLEIIQAHLLQPPIYQYIKKQDVQECRGKHNDDQVCIEPPDTAASLTTAPPSSTNFGLQGSIITGIYDTRPVIGVPQMINGMANHLSWTLNNPEVCLRASMVPMPPTFPQSSTSMHLARIESVDNSTEDYLMKDSGNDNMNLGQDFSASTLVEIMGNDSAWQPPIYGTFTNSEETLQQSLNSGHLLIPTPNINDTHIGEIQKCHIAYPGLAKCQQLQNENLQMASPHPRKCPHQLHEYIVVSV